MSQSSNFLNFGSNNGVLIKDAYQFHTFSPYLNNAIQNKFSSKCIFCSYNESTSLVNDEAFRQCNRCKKQFKANFIKK